MVTFLLLQLSINLTGRQDQFINAIVEVFIHKRRILRPSRTTKKE